ncbi:MAG: hypothetical protein L6Q98_03220 [Anaerolineae bacterium]|nr:hypothetical protein [Anaerolineae bacterium]NUQ02394.1 hypothetical protein [Anaerolineae bacterium]
MLAPFEGENRAVGYEALYAARLAAADFGGIWLELLPIDDGESEAVARAHALAADPLILAALALGEPAEDSAAVAAFGDLPVVIIGNWDAVPQPGVFLWAEERQPAADFRERYLSENAFAPEPGWLAQPVYDAASAVIIAAQTGSRAGAMRYLSDHHE